MSEEVQYILLPVGVVVLESILSASKVVEKLSSLSGWDNFSVEVTIISALIIVFGFVHWGKTRDAFKRLKRLKQSKEKLIASQVKPLIEEYRQERGYDLRVNVMTPNRKLFTWVEPGWPSFFLECLEADWSNREMKYDEDSDLVLTKRQGAAGEAYRLGRAVVVDLTEKDPQEYYLTEDQIDKTEEIRFVLSFPVMEKDPSTGRLTSNVVAILNIDSLDHGAEELIQDDQEFNELAEKAESLAEYCSLLY